MISILMGQSVTSDASSEVVWELRVSATSIYRAERISWENVLKTTVRPIGDGSTNSTADTTTSIGDLVDIANCQEATHFVDTNNPDNYIDYDLNGSTNADIFGEALAPVLSLTCDESTLFVSSDDCRNENAWEFHRYQENLSPLDQCNGMTRPDGSYAYYATDGWPYYLACYKGPTHLLSENNRLVNP